VSAPARPAKEFSISMTVASRPSFSGEWASEFDIIAKRSRALTAQFMGGFDDRPVSIAPMRGARSP
jgi:hypothetical protein